jgi:hypothetical protein
MAFLTTEMASMSVGYQWGAIFIYFQVSAVQIFLYCLRTNAHLAAILSIRFASGKMSVLSLNNTLSTG